LRAIEATRTTTPTVTTIVTPTAKETQEIQSQEKSVVFNIM
jgi:hypothetical protein